MAEVREFVIDGYKVKVTISIIEPLTGKFRATACFANYENSLLYMHDDKDKEIAVNEAISKLLSDGNPEIVEHL